MRVNLMVCIVVVLLANSASAGGKKAESAPGKSVSQLVADLKSKDAEARADAAEALGRKGSDAKDAVPDLIAALKDADENVRDAAADALGKMGPAAKAAVPRESGASSKQRSLPL